MMFYPVSGEGGSVDFWGKVLAHTATEDEFALDGRVFPVRILRRELEPNLPGFVGLINGVLIISEDVPEEYHPFFFCHEILCNLDYQGQPGRCVRAVVKELALVPVELKQQYLAYRTAFFERVTAYYANSPDRAFRSEIAGSHRYLKSLT